MFTNKTPTTTFNERLERGECAELLLSMLMAEHGYTVIPLKFLDDLVSWPFALAGITGHKLVVPDLIAVKRHNDAAPTILLIEVKAKFPSKYNGLSFARKATEDGYRLAEAFCGRFIRVVYDTSVAPLADNTKEAWLIHEDDGQEYEVHENLLFVNRKRFKPLFDSDLLT